VDQISHRGEGNFLAAETLTPVLYFDASHTSHTRAQTGIQRVCRSLYAALGEVEEITGVCHDPYFKSWRPLNTRELEHLRTAQAGTSSRGAKWPLRQRIAGTTRRLLGAKPALPSADGLICPELFSRKVGGHLPEIFARTRGPRVAIFHDAIGLKFPELTPPGTVARLPGYLRELLTFDGVAAVSEDSASSLRDYWSWLGLSNVPPIQAIPLGLDPAPTAGPGRIIPTATRILCVGTIEGRKNHLALLEACEALWQQGMSFELQLIGLSRADTAAPAIAKLAELKRAGRPLTYLGSVSDDALHSAYQTCAFTVYPSLIEGFGLPVLESLQHGKPCLCSAVGAIGESARGGGCLMLERVDQTNLKQAIQQLLDNPADLQDLTVAAKQRRLKSWAEYTRQLRQWMQTLSRRP
jgi:glycosyltransferase involved in cell wall biosynthesis